MNSPTKNTHFCVIWNKKGKLTKKFLNCVKISICHGIKCLTAGEIVNYFRTRIKKIRNQNAENWHENLLVRIFLISLIKTTQNGKNYREKTHKKLKYQSNEDACKKGPMSSWCMWRLRWFQEEAGSCGLKWQYHKHIYHFTLWWCANLITSFSQLPL